MSDTIKNTLLTGILTMVIGITYTFIVMKFFASHYNKTNHWLWISGTFFATGLTIHLLVNCNVANSLLL